MRDKLTSRQLERIPKKLGCAAIKNRRAAHVVVLTVPPTLAADVLSAFALSDDAACCDGCQRLVSSRRRSQQCRVMSLSKVGCLVRFAA